MKTQHTQGEWTARISSYGDYIAVDTEGIASSENRSILYKTFNPDGRNFNDKYYQEWKANAKLIAAAPDLLEALIINLDIIKLARDRVQDKNSKLWHELDAKYTLAQSAINKALK